MQAEKPQKCTSVRSDFTEISVSVVISTQFEFGAAIRGALFSVSLNSYSYDNNLSHLWQKPDTKS